MSGSASIFLEQAMLGHTLAFAAMPFPAQVFVALCAPVPPPTEVVRGIETFGGGYTRVAATFALAGSAANIAANVSSVEFPIASMSWGSVAYFELWDAVTGGNRLYWGQLIDPASGIPTALHVSAGDIVRFSSGTLAVQVATGSGSVPTSGGAYLPLAGGTLTGPLLLAADPATNLGAATKQYVDAHSGTGGGAGFLPVSGGTLTGPLTLVGDATASLQPVTLQQLNAASVAAGATYLSLAGGSLTGGLHAPWYHASGNTASYVPQGLYIMWSRAGDGDTYFVNNKGLGSGGFVFQNTDGTTDIQLGSLLPSGFNVLVPTAVSGTLSVSGNTFLHGAYVNGNLYQQSESFSGNDIDVSAAALFIKTISGATTLTVSNVPAGAVSSFILELTNGGSAAITWWAGITWAGGTPPTLSASGVDILGFYSPSGTSWRGMLLGKGMA